MQEQLEMESPFESSAPITNSWKRSHKLQVDGGEMLR